MFLWGSVVIFPASGDNKQSTEDIDEDDDGVPGQFYSNTANKWYNAFKPI